MRQFETGATRDSDHSKPDYEGFLSPDVIYRYGEYMNRNRVQADGQYRESDNWKKGIPKEAYMKSMWRHFLAAWQFHRMNIEGGTDCYEEIQDALCGVLFNAMGYLHEELNPRD